MSKKNKRQKKKDENKEVSKKVLQHEVDQIRFQMEQMQQYYEERLREKDDVIAREVAIGEKKDSEIARLMDLLDQQQKLQMATAKQLFLLQQNDAAKPAEPVKPAEGETSPKAAGTTETAENAEPAETAESMKPAESAGSTEPAEPAKPDETARAAVQPEWKKPVTKPAAQKKRQGRPGRKRRIRLWR